MKQRQHRKAVQRRISEAPTQYDRDCKFYGHVAWTKRERKAIATGKPIPMVFNRIVHDALREPFVLDSTADAVLHALTQGEAWVKCQQL